MIGFLQSSTSECGHLQPTCLCNENVALKIAPSIHTLLWLNFGFYFTHPLGQVEFVSPVESQNGIKVSRRSVKIIFLILASDWPMLVTWQQWWPLIGQYWSHDNNTGLSLVNTCQSSILGASESRRHTAPLVLIKCRNSFFRHPVINH